MRKKVKLKAVDFFCCAGGVTQGFKQAGIKVLGGIDIENIYKETYEKNNKGSRFIHADVAQLSTKDLEQTLGLSQFDDELIFVGCSPCQYYTNLQTDKTKSSKSKMLLEEFQRFVDYFKPGFIFIENVPGLESNVGSPLQRFKKFLDKNGYRFVDAVVNAADYNVPQNRRRYVLLATRLTNNITIPRGHSECPKTVRNAIGSLNNISAGHKDSIDEMHWASKLEALNLERLLNTSFNGGSRLEWKDNPKLQLNCYKGKDTTFPDVYGRIYWDSPAPTITTKFHSISNGRFGHPEQHRALSLREGAILQSFPISYKFYSSSMGTIAKMIGNAVPPKLAKKVALQFIKSYKLSTKWQNS
ncbi:DNA cytosine methyltransferase [Chitinophaga filiformis]|uniref:DNA (cytosine-5-)-methyltransferase n=1 Tax=Chitinophaga filiformis TaxID=104663 RepID=A0ABY4I9B6_CHIFI|nr:DNA cytosine methyltransferase [Chitinophaga filiformis]UPK72462.1 DNA cytosine methyltransferase [Chitinophaga filiformis]